jgi:hypothetical protein
MHFIEARSTDARLESVVAQSLLVLRGFELLWASEKNIRLGTG